MELVFVMDFIFKIKKGIFIFLFWKVCFLFLYYCFFCYWKFMFLKLFSLFFRNFGFKWGEIWVFFGIIFKILMYVYILRGVIGLLIF